MKKLTSLLPWLFLVFIYWQNISLAFVEGDDASTLLYHAGGRDTAMQGPYSAYQSFFDWMLAFLPSSDSSTLHISALLLTLVGGVIAFMVLRYFSFGANNGLFLLFSFLAIPEWLWMVLYINPAILAMGFYVLAFLLLYKQVRGEGAFYWILAALSMGFAVAIRWNFIMGYFVFIPFLFLNATLQFDRKNLRPLQFLKSSILYFFILSVVLSFSFIAISGYTVQQFLEIVLWGNTYLANVKLHPVVFLSSFIGYFTPVFLLVFFLGLSRGFQQQHRWILMVFVFALLPYFVLGFNPNFKFNLVLFLPIMLFLGLGFSVVVNGNRKKKYLVGFLTLLPWLFGVQIPLPDSAWGPELSFELPTSANNSKNGAPLLSGMRISLRSGNAMPNPEGVRPLYGFGDALIFGRWGAFNRARQLERQQLVDGLKQNRDCFLFADRPVALIQMTLIENGYQMTPFSQTNAIWQREFRTEHPPHTVHFITPGDFVSVAAFSELIHSYTEDSANCSAWYLTYPSMTAPLLDLQPNAVVMSPVTAILR